MTSIDRLRLLVLTGGGVGLLPYAPGTWGTAVGVLLFLPLAIIPEPYQSIALVLGILLFSWATVANGVWAEKHFGMKDNRSIVSDEIAGVFLTLLLFRLPNQLLWTALLVFPVNRFFDILKFPPARRLEEIPAGWGVLLDDILSSFYAGVVLLVGLSVYQYLFAS
jgi:phosphatidylglycerophosphatase A